MNETRCPFKIGQRVRHRASRQMALIINRGTTGAVKVSIGFGAASEMWVGEDILEPVPEDEFTLPPRSDNKP